MRVRPPSHISLPKDFIPSYSTCINDLISFYSKSNKLIVLTGAGLSTDSGIPDYRSPGRAPSNPILYNDFISNYNIRKRYWARGLIGYNVFNKTKPNEGHYILNAMRKKGKIHQIITQNVDGFHNTVGDINTLELHGNLHKIKCLSCKKIYPRLSLQEQMINENQQFYNTIMNINDINNIKPDGDIEILEKEYNNFILPRCLYCNSEHIHPDIVFMGGIIDTNVKELADKIIHEGDSLLVLGSTVTVLSAYRLVRLAYKRKLPISIINIGNTRCDPITSIKIEDNITKILKILNK